MVFERVGFNLFNVSFDLFVSDIVYNLYLCSTVGSKLYEVTLDLDDFNLYFLHFLDNLDAYLLYFFRVLGRFLGLHLF